MFANNCHRTILGAVESQVSSALFSIQFMTRLYKHLPVPCHVAETNVKITTSFLKINIFGKFQKGYA